MHRPSFVACVVVLSSVAIFVAGECATGTSTARTGRPGAPLLPLSQPTRPRHAVLVSRGADCASRLGFAAVFQRSLVGLRFEGVGIVDGGVDAALTRRDNLPDVPVLPSTTAYSMFADVARLPLPLLLIYGSDRRLQMAIHAPVTAAGAEALVEWLAAQ